MMTREDRAKQFAPFDAMKGLQEALRDREERYCRVQRHEISEEQMERNSEVFIKLRKGMKVRADCYYEFHDISMQGAVTAIDIAYRYLKINSNRLHFADIYDIEILDAK